jgi:uncharacterized protein
VSVVGQPGWRVLAQGTATGALLVLQAPLSFWGGYDAATGRIIDAAHPDTGKSCAGRIVAMAQTKGSSSASSVFAEAIRRGTAPAAIILGRPCGILATGALVADALYGIACPVIVAPVWPLEWEHGAQLEIGAAGAGALRIGEAAER